jgi:hypothetical protein
LSPWQRKDWLVDSEEQLAGGNLSGAVVRVGQTVRRPVGRWTPAVHALLTHLEAVGFDGAPRVMGIDEQGREILEFIDGEVPWEQTHRRLLGTPQAIQEVGRLLRRFHDAVASFVPPVGATWRYPEMQADAEPWIGGSGTIVCHNDPAAWNLVVNSQRWALIDWDAAGPRPFIWDVAYAAVGMVPIGPDARRAGWMRPPPVGARLRALADGYGLAHDDLMCLPDVIVARIRSSYLHMRRRAMAGMSPWDRLWNEGHGATWAGMLAFAEQHGPDWRVELG